MAKNILKNIAPSGYDWKYSTVGGVTRVNIETGSDIAHLDQLDQKLWTVLSCPVQGLEFDAKTLALLDADHDGRIRVNEVIAASQWLNRVLCDMNLLTAGQDHIRFSDIQDATDEGRQVLDSARLILKVLGLNQEDISIANVAAYMEGFEEKCKADYQAAEGDTFTPPYGDASDDAEAAVAAIRAKIDDYFMRCKLARFDEEATAALDVQVEKIAAISGGDLAAQASEIATYPLFRPSAEAMLPLQGNVNPAWQAAFATLKSAVLDTDFPGRQSISEDDWNATKAKVDAYTAWKAAGATAMDEAVAAQIAEHASAIEPVDKLLHLLKDFYQLLHNFVVFKDFYNRAPGSEAIFQAGRLFIDQRCCDLCIRVSDMGKATASAGKSGMYLLFCHCVSKVKGQEMDIVAAVTAGDVRDLHEGKNAIFYDRAGQDWDATVTKIIDNPISIAQAFWSPYRKFGNWVSDKITKNAQEKEAKGFEDMTAKADTATADLAAKQAAAKEGAPAPDAAAKPAAPFDIAKFAGIFAAISIALGAIGGALAALGGFVAAKWYNVILLVSAVFIIISGPSMLLAYLKLRKRNLGPVLNANGWAINSMVKVNVPFGNTLTQEAKYPKVAMSDPFAEKKTPWPLKCLYWLLFIAVVVFCVMFFTHKLPWQKKAAAAPTDSVKTELVDTAAVQAPAAEPEA